MCIEIYFDVAVVVVCSFFGRVIKVVILFSSSLSISMENFADGYFML